MVLAIAATLSAAVLVVLLQHRAISTLQSQTRIILRQLSEQTAADIAAELHRTLDGPVFNTLTAVNHPELREGRLDLVARHYATGLDAYPHVDRFIVWHATTERSAPGEVMFFGRDGAFRRDPEFGRAVLTLARRYAPTQQIYVAAEGLDVSPRTQVFLRLFWNDARRMEYFAVLGFTVDPERMRQQLFATLDGSTMARVLARRGPTPLQFRVADETGAVVHGAATAAAESSRVLFPMLFYPVDEIRSRLAAGVEPRVWSIEVSAPPVATAWTTILDGYGPVALSIVLMFVALWFTARAQRRSTELARMQADFVAHVTHQLKTPLSLLSTATETLQLDRVRSPDRFREYLATIHAEAARLSLLVQRVLEFSRLQQRRSYEFEEVDLAALVRETVDALAHSVSNEGFIVHVEQEGDNPLVLADPAALEQVLINLLDNAMKYSAARKDIIVKVCGTRRDAMVEVIDHGLGIAPVDQVRIFDRFYRTSDTARQPGFGLGLPIVKEVIHAHDGRVEVDSRPGAGSTFRIVLPRHIEARSANDRGRKIPEVAS
jgi:signal transduction histidine kinase